MSKRKPGRPPTHTQPTTSTSAVIFADQYAKLEAFATRERVSQSEIVRRSLDLFFAVNIGIITNVIDREEDQIA